MSFKTFTRFLGHHVSDLNAVANALGSIVDALPVNRQDRERITATISKVKDSASNVLDSLDTIASRAGSDADSSDSMTTAPTRADFAKAVEGAVLDALPGVLETALAAHFAAHPVAAPAPAIVPGTPGPGAALASDAATGKGTAPTDQQAKGDGSGEIVTA